MEAEKLGRRWHGTSNPRQHMRPPAHRHSLLDATFHSHEQTGLEARSGLCLCMAHVAAWRMLASRTVMLASRTVATQEHAGAAGPTAENPQAAGSPRRHTAAQDGSTPKHD